MESHESSFLDSWEQVYRSRDIGCHPVDLTYEYKDLHWHDSVTTSHPVRGSLALYLVLQVVTTKLAFARVALNKSTVSCL